MKKRLFISFSGGLTSGYMTHMLLNNLDRSKWDIAVLFANTGKEREETLEFVKNCDEHFGFNTIWVEAVINPEYRKGTTSRVVEFETASRNGEPFEAMIQKYGIPNSSFIHCTRELKTQAMTHYVRKVLGWNDYYTAIGIRADEADRANDKHKELKYWYPLIEWNKRRQDVNQFWKEQSFTLNLKSYEGNCDLCYKKTLRKLLTLILERPQDIAWWKEMEEKYSYFIPVSRLKEGQIQTPVRFYRENRSIDDLIQMAARPFIPSRDESNDIVREQLLFPLDVLDISNGCTESCEPF